MKKRVFRRTLCVLLAGLFLAQWSFCAAAQPAASGGVAIYRYVYGVRDDGTWEQGYMTDRNGSRIRWGADARIAAQAVFPEKYDLRDKQLVTSVKNQCSTGTCWAFGSIAAAESNYIKNGYGSAEDTDFSEAHLVWFSHRPRSVDPTDPLYGEGYSLDNPFQYGGIWQINSAAMMRGSGLQTEANAPWNDPQTEEEAMEMALPESDRYACAAQLWSVESLWEISESAIKLKIMQNGAAALAFCAGYNNYNKKHQCMYQNRYSNADHEVCVVGWDDHFSRKNFSVPRPKSDGAWLIKNSWGDMLTEDGYLWLSYEDPSIESVESYVMAPADVYDNRYQYDATCPEEVIVGSGSAKMANVFTARKAEELTHAAFFSLNPYPMPATAEVYVGSADAAADSPLSGMHRVDAATTTIGDVSLGYRTVELREPVTLQAGETFAVVITITNPAGAEVAVPVEGETPEDYGMPMPLNAGACESFVFVNGSWQDTTAFRADADSEPLNLHNVAVKAMTRDLEAGEPVLTVTSVPQRKTYAFGETPDLTGLLLTYTAADGTQTVLDADGCTCLTQKLENYGTVPVILSYRGVRAAFNVEVLAGELSLTLPDTSKATLLCGKTLRLEPSVEGAPDDTLLFIRQDRMVDGKPYSRTRYAPVGEPLFVSASRKNAKECLVTLTLTDRFGDPIMGADDKPITVQKQITLKNGPFYAALYLFRLIFEDYFGFLMHR